MNGILELLKNAKVEWKTLGEVCEIQRGRVISKKYLEEHKGCYPVYSSQTKNNGEIGKIDTYDFDGEYATWTTDGAYAGTIFYRNGKFSITNICGLISVKDDSSLLIKFIVYWLQIEAKKYVSGGSGNPKLMSNVVVQIPIPIPPIELQREIVRILDTFSELIAELQAELQAELILRQKQYEYYLNMLLKNTKGEKVELGSVCAFVRGPFGGSLKKSCFRENGYAVYEQQHAINGNLDFRYFIDENKFNELKRFEVKVGDMIVSCSGTIGKVFIIPNEAPKGIINQALLKLTPLENLDIRYLKYLFEGGITKEFNDSKRGGAIENVPSVQELKKIKILLPNIKEQKRIVSILDKFSEIANDLEQGLPAEINLRQKQYEYYRNLLLSFPNQN